MNKEGATHALQTIEKPLMENKMKNSWQEIGRHFKSIKQMENYWKEQVVKKIGDERQSMT